MKLDTSPAIEVTVCVAGRSLTEYEDVDDYRAQDFMKGVTYVEAVPDEEFAVYFNAYKAQMGGAKDDHLELSVYVDGKRALSKVLKIHDGLPGFRWTSHFKGVNRRHNGAYVLEPFKFASLNTDDRPLQGEKPDQFQQLGEIEVQCVFVRPTGERVPINHDQKGLKLSSEETLPEKCLKGKAISNKVALGAPQPLNYTLYTVNVEHPYGKNPFATYIFKYRSRGDLRDEHVIPRTPSPVRLEDRDPDDLSPEEARELVRRMRAREEVRVKIKQENQRPAAHGRQKRDHVAYMEDEDENGEVTFAGNAKRSRPVAATIDLTDD